jgi:hypothetical protein
VELISQVFQGFLRFFGRLASRKIYPAEMVRELRGKA